MEKFGLFDLIDKLSSSASSKKEFTNKENSQTSNEENTSQKSEIITTISFPPQHYMMNEKMISFCKKHEEFKKTVIKP